MRYWEWTLAVALLLLAWCLRLCYLEEVPPGWRDDELINIHALSSRLLRGEFPVYYLGASGHEPLYHHLHAGVHAVLGFNVLSGRILSVAFGMLSVALTYSLIRRLFPSARWVAIVATLMLTMSFWSLMYSRTAIRHISLPPLVLSTIYALWRCLDADRLSYWRWGLVGLLLGVSLYTYTASRLLPVLVLVFLSYLALFHLERLKRQWRGIAVAVVVMALVIAPLVEVIAEGRSRRAIEGIGADARVTELAQPLRALQGGDLQPLLISTVKTLGMFHSSGDPEWLYNIPGRPVFNLFGGMLLWAGVALCLCRWREPSYFFLLPWLALGLSPGFVSVPPASLGHTIVAQPVAYILPALALVRITGWLSSQSGNRARSTRLRSAAIGLILVAFVISNAVRDIRDYFFVWPERGMVRFLYRADQREAAAYLNAHPEITDVAIESGLRGPWDRIALDVDIKREDVATRLFNPERALLWPAGDEPSTLLLSSWPDPARPIEAFLGSGRDVSPHLTLHAPSTVSDAESVVTAGGFAKTRFANGLTLSRVGWLSDQHLVPGQEADLLTVWCVSEPLDLPPIPVVAQPPPPKTYAGPRLAVFAHLVGADGEALDVDDGLWVDPLTLRPGDRFVQIHRFSLPSDPPAEPYAIQLGLYDPKTDRRWNTLGADGQPRGDLVQVSIGKQPWSR